MKLIILILIAINTVLCGKCPTEEIAAPCKCESVSNKT